MRTKHYTSRI